MRLIEHFKNLVRLNLAVLLGIGVGYLTSLLISRLYVLHAQAVYQQDVFGQEIAKSVSSLPYVASVIIAFGNFPYLLYWVREKPLRKFKWWPHAVVAWLASCLYVLMSARIVSILLDRPSHPNAAMLWFLGSVVIAMNLQGWAHWILLNRAGGPCNK